MAGPVAFTTVHRGSDSHIEAARNVTVLTAAQWSALWKEHAPGTPAPRVDFTREMVVGVFLGSRPTGGYSVTIAAVEAKGADLIVTYRVAEPSRDAMVTQALTSPVHLVRIPQQSGAVRFERATAPAEPRR
jgi:hypothetical protein